MDLIICGGKNWKDLGSALSQNGPKACQKAMSYGAQSFGIDENLLSFLHASTGALGLTVHDRKEGFPAPPSPSGV